MDNVTRLLMQGAAGASGDKTYIDDVFSTYLWDGSGSSRSINNGINLSEEGGLVWIKNRDAAENYGLFDTARGAGKWVVCNANNAEDTDANRLSAFNNNGFSLGTDTMVNNSSADYASWTFRKQKGFFDVVTYTGTQVAGRTVAHSLGSVPGMIFIKRLNDAEDWAVYHRQVGATKALTLNENSAPNTNSAFFNNTEPTASVFSVGTSDRCNKNGQTYVAYVFAGGESTAATARSVDFDGSSDGIQFEASSSGIAVGTGNFTCEFWVNLNGDTTGNDALVDTRTSAMNQANGFQIYLDGNRKILGYTNTDMFGSTTATIPIGVWTHVAVVRTASTAIKLYVNGNQVGTTYTGSQDFDNSALVIAGNANVATETNCKISNLRLNKGEGLYSASFRPPTEPLTTTSQGSTASNVKILACNNSSVTGGTVLPATVTSFGNPTASTDSPFDDPEGYKFGGEGDQNIIKCGSYVGNGNADGPEIFLGNGWEPQYVLVKDLTSNNSWRIFDSMRGISTGYDDALLHPNSNGAEYSGNTNEMDLTSTGFKIVISDSGVNGNGNTYMYTAIRRPDGYVGKPAEAGTDVYFQNMLNAADDPSIRSSTFAGDLGIIKTKDIANSWNLGTRLTQGRGLDIDSTSAEGSNSNWMFDFMNGANVYNNPSVSFISYLWKRGAGFDVVTYTGNNTAGHQIPHSLNKVPEMIWIKNRTTTGRDWSSYHKGFNGGVNPWLYKMTINHTDGERSNSSFFGTAPTTSHFGVGGSADTNGSGENIIAFLFASVDGISKVGSYDGSATSHTITTGFQPRMVIIKEYSTDGQSWWMLDTVRGWTAGNDNGLQLNATTVQTSHDFGAPTATGFTLVGGHDGSSNAGKKYIYYAHA